MREEVDIMSKIEDHRLLRYLSSLPKINGRNRRFTFFIKMALFKNAGFFFFGML